MRVLLVLILLINFAFAEEEEKLNKVKIPKEVLQSLDIKVEKVKKQSIEFLKKYPSIVKDDLTLSQAIYSPVEGLVKKLFVKEGDKVKKGQKVALIYSPEITKLLSKIYLAKVNLENAKRIFEREKQLYEKRIIPYTRYFSALTNYEMAKGKLEALNKSLKAYGEIKNGLVILRSGLDGYVAKQDVILGDSVGTDRRLFKIHAHNRLWVIAFAPVEDLKLFSKGEKVEVISPLGITYGTVDFISHAVDPKTKRNPVRIIANNDKDILKPNMFVDTILKRKLPKGIYIPASAVVYQDNETLVFVKDNGYFYPVRVKLGKRYGKYFQVLNGLKEGDEVVVKGAIYLKAKFFGEAEE